MSALPARGLAWRPLGEILLERGLISPVELDDALRSQKHEGGRLGEILFERGCVSAVDLRDALADQHGLDLRVERKQTGRARPTSIERLDGSVPLGRLLVRRGHVTHEQLDAALAEQGQSGQRLGQILIASGAVSAFVLAAALAEQQGLVTASQELWEQAQNHGSGEERRYEVREITNGHGYRLYVSRNFLDATDLAFAILNEWEPKELLVLCIADGGGQQLCWRYPPVA